MKYLLRFCLAGLLLSLVCLLALLAWRTSQFKSLQPPAKASALQPYQHSQAAIEHLSRAIALPTVSLQEPSAKASDSFDQLHQLFQKSYPAVYAQLKPQRLGNSLLIHWPGKRPQQKPLLLAAHLDVVPVESPQSWQEPPFSGRVKDKYIWGRGTLDDKGSAIAILEALEDALDAGLRPQRGLYIALGEDEEIGGAKGAQRMVGWLKSQGVRLAAVLDEGTAIVPGALVGLAKPVALIGIAEKGYLTLELKAQLAGGHSSMPAAETAIDLLSQALLRIRQNPLPARLSGPANQLFNWLGPEMPLMNRLALANRWLSEPLLLKRFESKPSTNAMIRTTIAPTMLKGSPKENVLAAEASALVNLRVLPGDSLEQILAHFKRVIQDSRVHIRAVSPVSQAPASKVSQSDSEVFSILAQSIRQVFPEALIAPSLVLAATDSRHYEKISDNIYRFLPVSMSESDFERVHGKNERISQSNYLQSIQFYRQLLANL